MDHSLVRDDIARSRKLLVANVAGKGAYATSVASHQLTPVHLSLVLAKRTQERVLSVALVAGVNVNVEFFLMHLQFARTVVNTVARFAHEAVNVLKRQEKY